MVKVPVGLGRGNLGVVVVEGAVGGTLQVVGNDTAQQDGEDGVLLTVGLVFIESDQDQGVVHKVVILQQWGHEVSGPLTCNLDVGVVGVVGHVWGNDDVLWQLFVSQVLLEVGKVLHDRQSGRVGGVGVIQSEWVVLSDIVVGKVLLIGVVEAEETGVWKMLLVCTEGDSLVVQQVGNCGDILWQTDESVVVQGEVVTTDGGHVIWLRRVGKRPVVGQCDTLGSNPGHVWLFGSLVEIGVFQPDDHEAVKGLTLDVGGPLNGAGVGSILGDLRWRRKVRAERPFGSGGFGGLCRREKSGGNEGDGGELHCSLEGACWRDQEHKR